jgi:undecaprenyl-diphosphatase
MAAAPVTGKPSQYVFQIFSLGRQSLTKLVRAPSHSRRAAAARRLAFHWLLIAAIGALTIAALMFELDEREIGLMPARGTAALWPARILTDFGKAAYVLWVLAAILAIILAATPRLRKTSRLIWISFGLRIQFLCLAVAVPMIAGEIVKGIVGRGRPFVGGHANAFNYSHFAWTESYASFPSGHAIVSVALAFAISALWPRMRTIMIVYVVLIIGSRLLLLAHHPSDVVAGGLLGIIGAMFVRYWFAARHLCFSIDGDGRIRPLAGPSSTHLKRVARDAFAP